MIEKYFEDIVTTLNNKWDVLHFLQQWKKQHKKFRRFRFRFKSFHPTEFLPHLFQPGLLYLQDIWSNYKLILIEHWWKCQNICYFNLLCKMFCLFRRSFWQFPKKSSTKIFVWYGDFWKLINRRLYCKVRLNDFSYQRPPSVLWITQLLCLYFYLSFF